MPIFESSTSNGLRPVRRFGLVSYDRLKVKTFDAELSGVLSIPSASVIAFLLVAYDCYIFLS